MIDKAERKKMVCEVFYDKNFVRNKDGEVACNYPNCGAKVKAGNYTLIATYIGYDTTEINITLKAGQILSQNIEIAESSIKLNEVIISEEICDPSSIKISN